MKGDRTLKISNVMITKYFKKTKKELSCHKCGRKFYLGDIVSVKKNPKGRYFCQECFKSLYIDPFKGMNKEQIREHEIREDEELDNFFLPMNNNKPTELRKTTFKRFRGKCSICNSIIERDILSYRGNNKKHTTNICSNCVKELPKDQYIILED